MEITPPEQRADIMALNRDQLLKMSQAELDSLFREASAGNLPNGEGTGTAVVCPGTAV